MDPKARQAIKNGQAPEVVRAALQEPGAVTDPATRSRLQDALKQADINAGELRKAAEVASRDPSLPPPASSTLKDALGQGATPTFGWGPGGATSSSAPSGSNGPSGPDVPFFTGATLDGMDPIQKAAAKRAATQQAAQDAVKTGAAPKQLQAALQSSESADLALEQAVKKAAGKPQSNLGEWGPAGDMDGMDPLSRRALAAENARSALRQAGLDEQSRKELQNALAASDAKQKDLLTACESASTLGAMPAANKAALKNIPDFTGADLDGMEPVLRGALARGKVPVAARKALETPGVAALPVANQLRAASQDVDARDKELENVMKKMAGDSKVPAATRGYLNDALGGKGWEGSDGMDPMQQEAVRRGRMPVAARSALKNPGLADADKKALEEALRAADAAAMRLNAQGSAALAEPRLPPAARKALTDAGLKPAPAAQGSSLLGGAAAAPPGKWKEFGAPDPTSMAGMDPLQRAAIARGRATEAARMHAAALPQAQRKGVEDAIKSSDSADDKLNEGVRAVLKDPKLASGQRRLLEEAMAGGDWGAAPDLEGMDPIARAALSRGLTAEAVRALLRDPELSPAHRAQLQKLLDASDKANQQVGSAVSSAASANPQSDLSQGLQKAVEAGRDPWSGFDGDFALDQGWGPIVRAAVRGAIPEAVRNVTTSSASDQHIELKTKLADADQKFSDLTSAVRGALAQQNLTPDARRRLEDALAGKWGPGDLSGMDPLKAAEGGIVSLAVRAAIDKGGVTGAAKAQLEAALKASEQKQGELTQAVRAVVKDPSTSAAHKRQLEDALYGKVRGARDVKGAAGPAAGSEFAPLKPTGLGIDLRRSAYDTASTQGMTDIVGSGDKQANLRRNMALIEQMQRARAGQPPPPQPTALAPGGFGGLTLGGSSPVAKSPRAGGLSLGGVQPTAPPKGSSLL